MRWVLLLVLASVLAGCQPRVDADPEAAPGVPVQPPDWTVPRGTSGLASAVGLEDVLVVAGELRWGGGLAVFDRHTRARLWTVEPRPDDGILEAWVARGSVVVVRRDWVNVYDLKTGADKLSMGGRWVVTVGWTMLFVEGEGRPLQAVELPTGRELWQAPSVQPASVMLEPGRMVVDHHVGEPPRRHGELRRAPEVTSVAMRVPDGVAVVDPLTGKELSRIQQPFDNQARVTDRILLHWGRSGASCAPTVTARDIRTGTLLWRQDVGARPVKPVTDREDKCPPIWQPEVAAGLLAFTTPDGQPSVLDIETGRVIWTGDVDAQWLGMNERAILVRGFKGRDVLAAVHAHTGAELWTAELPRDAYGHPKPVGRATFSGETLAYSTPLVRTRTTEDLTWVRNLVSGRVLWVAKGPKPLVFDGDALLTGYYEQLGSFRLSTG
ncbi:MAG TPA: PQQ-binding-like beta-propeller repeat protein [Candidatus Limnocylindrales bacterium]